VHAEHALEGVSDEILGQHVVAGSVHEEPEEAVGMLGEQRSI
jgi:hypothetical protein